MRQPVGTRQAGRQAGRQNLPKASEFKIKLFWGEAALMASYLKTVHSPSGLWHRMATRGSSEQQLIKTLVPSYKPSPPGGLSLERGPLALSCSHPGTLQTPFSTPRVGQARRQEK